MNQRLVTYIVAILCVLLCISQVYSQPTLDPGQTVNPATGEMAFSLPLGVVKGVNGNDFPINLSYKAGIQYHQSASEVGLGFSIGAGGIGRKVIFVPDDYEPPVPGEIVQNSSWCDEPFIRKFFKALLTIVTVIVTIVATILSCGVASESAIAASVIISWIWAGVKFAADAIMIVVMASFINYLGGGDHLPKYNFEAGGGWGFFTGDSRSHYDLPDIYIVNTPYVSGEIVWIGDKENGRFVFKMTSGSQDKDKQTKKVTYNPFTHRFQIILENGTRLLFNQQSFTYGRVSSNTSFIRDTDSEGDHDCKVWSTMKYDNKYIESWHLTEVLFPDYIDGGDELDNPMDSQDANKGGWIHFGYRWFQSDAGENSWFKRSGVMQVSPYSNSFFETGSREIGNAAIVKSFLSKITTPNQKAWFSYYDTRLDDWYTVHEIESDPAGGNPHPRKQHMPCLRAIEIYSQDKEVLNTIKFKTDYTLRPNTYLSLAENGKCLTLQEVIFETGDGNKLPSVKFHYDPYHNNFEGFNSSREGYAPKGAEELGRRPRFYLEEKDYWGYYRKLDGAANNFNPDGDSVLAYYTENGIAKPYASAWSLDKITLPSGMSIKWIYEAHRYDKANNQTVKADGSVKFGGGIRVKEMIVNDGYTHLEKNYRTNYFYTDKPGHFDENETGVTSSGHATAEPYCYLSEEEKRLNACAFGGLYTPAIVSYEVVQVVKNYNKDTQSAPYGYTVYKVVTPADDECQNGGRYDEVDYSWKRGMIRSIAQYSSDKKIIQEKRWNYAYGKRLQSVFNVNYDAKYIEFNTAGTVYLKDIITTVDGVTSEQNFKYAFDDYGNENIKDKVTFDVTNSQFLFANVSLYPGGEKHTAAFEFGDDEIKVHLKNLPHPNNPNGVVRTSDVTISNIVMGELSTADLVQTEWVEQTPDYDYCETFDTVFYEDTFCLNPSCEYTGIINGEELTGKFDAWRSLITIQKTAAEAITQDYDGRPNYTITTNSNDSRKITEIIPAFTESQYDNMVEDRHHLLSAISRQRVYHSEVDASKVVSASASSWNLHGRWRPLASYVWNENLQVNNLPENSLNPFNFATGADNPNWLYTGNIQRFDNHGQVIESVQPTDYGDRIHSVTIFGYKSTLPIATIANACFEECGVYTAEYDNFDTNLDGEWFDYFNQWEKPNGHSEDSELEVIESGSHFGEKGLYVKDSFGPTKNFTIKPGKGYILSAWIYPISANPVTLMIEIHKDGLTPGNPDDMVIGTTQGLTTGQWHYCEVPIPLEKLTDIAGNDDLFRVWIGNGNEPGDLPTEFFIDDIRFYPDNAMVTTSYYDQKLYKSIVSVDVNNNPGNKVIYDSFGRVITVNKMFHNQDDIPIQENEYHFKKVDAAANHAPTYFQLLEPAHEDILHQQEITLKWEDKGDPDGDQVIYNVYIMTPNEEDFRWIASTHDNFFTTNLLPLNTEIFWKILALDWLGDTGADIIRTFTLENYPPTKSQILYIKPGIPTESEFKDNDPIDMEWSASTDPDNDAIEYYVEAEAANNLGHKTFGPFDGTEPPYTERPKLPGMMSYKISVIAVDEFGTQTKSDPVPISVQPKR